MKVDILELLDYLSRTGVEMNQMNIIKEDADEVFGVSLNNYTGVVGNDANEPVKRGMYLYSDAFDNDAELLNMADRIYNHENESTKILYFAVE